ncbi:MAG: DUF3237 domain-containing protein [Betaproteobacteria bacterium]|nr:MAG: DUF3237 domain-containing protein [Betaproteobacteria bacterium]
MDSRTLPTVSVIPGLKPLYTSRIDIAVPLDLGQTPGGRRRIVKILGGAFSGARMSGRVLPGGADWQIVRSDGILEVEARYTLETDDGALISITNRGLRHGPAEVMRRLGAGEAVDPAEYYFRTTPVFETGAPGYAWLNGIIAVAVGERRADAVIITAYEVT